MNLFKTALRPTVRIFRTYQNRHSRDYFLKMLPKHSTGAELGVWEGGLSREILRVVKPSTLYLIDPWKYAPELERAWYGSANESQESMDARHGRVVERFRDQQAVRVTRGKSADVLPTLSNLDWAIIDGDHRYEAVLTDLHLVHRAVKPRSLVVCDDYVKDGKWWGDGVKRAVQDIVRQGLYEIVLVRENQAVLQTRFAH
jgi:hypothetical protein